MIVLVFTGDQKYLDYDAAQVQTTADGKLVVQTADGARVIFAHGGWLYYKEYALTKDKE